MATKYTVTSPIIIGGQVKPAGTVVELEAGSPSTKALLEKKQITPSTPPPPPAKPPGGDPGGDPSQDGTDPKTDSAKKGK